MKLFKFKSNQLNTICIYGLCLPMAHLRVKRIWADGGYAGKLIKWAEDETSWTLEIVKRNELHTFKVLPKRWLVERTFGWLSYCRIMNRHHERKYDTAENIMRIALQAYLAQTPRCHGAGLRQLRHDPNLPPEAVKRIAPTGSRYTWGGVLTIPVPHYHAYKGPGSQLRLVAVVDKS